MLQLNDEFNSYNMFSETMIRKDLTNIIEWVRREELARDVINKLKPYLEDMGFIIEGMNLRYDGNGEFGKTPFDINVSYLVPKVEETGMLWVDVLDEEIKYYIYECK